MKKRRKNRMHERRETTSQEIIEHLSGRERQEKYPRKVLRRIADLI